MGTQVLVAFPGGPEKPKLLSVVFALLEEADSPLVYGTRKVPQFTWGLG